MKVVDIRYGAQPEGGWCVPDPADGHEIFPTREAAIAAATSLAKARSFSEGEPYFICIEGADGRWRLFDANMQAVVGDPAQGP
jgi:uncharacterized protein DUF2188